MSDEQAAGAAQPPRASQAELGFIPAKLPSRGALYEGKIPDGEIHVRKLSFDEEDMLLSQGAQGLERMEIILKNCTKLPNDFKHPDLLLTDRMATMLAIRTVAFGPRYSFDYKCRFCPTMQQASVNILEDLNENTPETIALKMLDKGVEDWTLEEPIEVQLPDAGRVVDLRFLRGYDEMRIVKRAKRLLLQSVDSGDPSSRFRFALQIVRVDGVELDLGKKELFLRTLNATDKARMRIAIEEIEPGIDLTVYPECRACGAVNKMPMPFTAEFFRPSSL
jgi:hypothetical protein